MRFEIGLFQGGLVVLREGIIIGEDKLCIIALGLAGLDLWGNLEGVLVSYTTNH